METSEQRLAGAPKCPYCGKKADGYSSLSGQSAPKTGDRCICFYCAQVAAYVVSPLTGAVRLRKLDAAEQKDADANPDIQRAMNAIMASKPKGAETLPCGCVIDTVGDAFVMQPCSPDCEYYLYAMEQAAAKGTPVSYMMDPEI